jgi:hypothetical protein
METQQEFRKGTAETAATVGKLIVRLRSEGLLTGEDVDRILRTAIADAIAMARPGSRRVVAFLGAMHGGYVDGELEFAY